MSTMTVYLALFAAIAVACLCKASGSQLIKQSCFLADKEHGRGMENIAQDMMAAFSLARNMIEMMLSVVSPMIQIKSFGMSVVNVLINVIRLVMQMQHMEKIQEMQDWQKAIFVKSHVPIPMKYYVADPEPEYRISEPESKYLILEPGPKYRYAESEPEHEERPEQPTHYYTLDRLSNLRHGEIIRYT